MKKNVYLTVLAIVTVICILFGSIYHIIGFGLDVFDALIMSDSDDDNSREKISMDPVELETFTNISIDADLMDLTLETGNGYRISYRCNKKMTPEYRVESDTLYITQSPASPLGNNNQCTVVVTVPADVLLSMVSIDLDLGDVDLDSIKTQSLDLTARLGDVDLEHCELGSSTVSANLGDVDLDDCGFTNLDVTVDMGDLYVNSSAALSDHTIEAEIDMGELEINGNTYRNKFSQAGQNGYTVSLRSHMGDVELTW